MTATDLQEAVGTQRWQTVGEWLNHGVVPGHYYMRKIAKVLNVDVDELLGVAHGQEPPFESWSTFLATAEGQSLTEDERRSLQAVPWPRGQEPTLSSYLMALQAIRTTVQRRK